MKNLPIILAIIILLLLGIGGYWYMHKTPSSEMANNVVVPTQSAGGSAMMSMKDLLALNKNQMCTFSHTGKDGSSQSGTTYMSAGKLRTDYNVSFADAQTHSGGMINDGAYIYSWINDNNQGTKMAITADMNKAAEDANKNLANNPSKYVNPDEKMDYKCNSWTPDSNKFVPPSTVTFMDFSDMMKHMPNTMQTSPDVTNAQCGACDSLQDANAKAMCKKSLNCQ